MQAELKALQIDRTKKSGAEPARWATRWIIGGVLLFVLLGAARFAYTKLTAATEVDIVRVHAESSAAAGPGVVLNAKTSRDVMESRQLHKNDKYLLQQFIVPNDLDGRRGWFRVYCAFGEIIPCWWDDLTHRYSELSPEDERRFGLGELRDIMRTIEGICGLDFFSSEIALTEKSKFVVVDYVNEVCDMRLQSRYANGAPDAVVHRIEELIADAVASRIHRLIHAV